MESGESGYFKKLKRSSVKKIRYWILDKKIKALKLLNACLDYDAQLQGDDRFAKYDKLKLKKENLDGLNKKYEHYNEILIELKQAKNLQNAIKSEYASLNKNKNTLVKKLKLIEKQNIQKLDKALNLAVLSIAYKFEQTKKRMDGTKKLFSLKSRFNTLDKLNVLLKINMKLKSKSDGMEKKLDIKDAEIASVKNKVVTQKGLLAKMIKWQELFQFKSMIEIK